jgi:cytochrome bd-type quinol oxidase subunit 2
MNGERFTAADLEPSDREKAAIVRSHVDRGAAVVAVLALGVVIGGMVAMGACAAPFVFRMVPAPDSGNAMGAAFARFDQVAIGSAVVLLAAEIVRTWAAGGRARQPLARVRRILAFFMAGCAVYVGLALTPRINGMHHEGVQRWVGERGQELEAVHQRAELVGKLEVALGIALVALHVLTISARRPEEDEEDDYAAPLPPGAPEA